MNHNVSDDRAAGAHALPDRSFGLATEDLWWFDRTLRPWAAPRTHHEPPSRVGVPAQSRAQTLSFRSLNGSPADRQRVAALVARCTSEALRARFFMTCPIQRKDVLDRCCDYLLAGPPQGAALLAGYGQEAVGVLNAVPIGPELAEAGILVAPAWQRRGVARALIEELRRDPRWNGWTLRAVVQWENIAVRHLVQSLPGTARTVSLEPDCIVVDLHPSPLPHRPDESVAADYRSRA